MRTFKQVRDTSGVGQSGAQRNTGEVGDGQWSYDRQPGGRSGPVRGAVQPFSDTADEGRMQQSLPRHDVQHRYAIAQSTWSSTVNNNCTGSWLFCHMHPFHRVSPLSTIV